MDLEILKILFINSFFSLVAGYASYYFVSQYIPIFIGRKLCGSDQCKINRVPVAEPLGVVAAAVYLIFVFAFLPVPFYQTLNAEPNLSSASSVRLLSLLAAVISICTAILLGFADDVLDLRWRHKLLFPTLSSLPLLMVYYISHDRTAMLLPNFIQNIIGTTYIELGVLFYVYMAMLVIFCTNAINIIAGINGIEVGQSLVVALSVIVFNIVQIFRLDKDSAWNHCLSFCILCPFLTTSIGLFLWNKYPAKAFVGDTYCYWAGMTLAVVGINGHFSKTLLLFLIPQIFNFLYSCPQLFGFIPCPRHRLPKLNLDDGRLHMSMAEYDSKQVGALGKLFVAILRTLGLLHYEERVKEDEIIVNVNNMTILNLVLKFFGPMYEYELTNRLLLLQLLCSILAFVCRFFISKIFYDIVQ